MPRQSNGAHPRVGQLAAVMPIVVLAAGVAQILLIALVVLLELAFVVYAMRLLFRAPS